MRHDLRNARILITGGGNGIGRLLALKSADRGAHVIVWDLSAESGEKVAEEIRAKGGTCDAYTVDVTNREDVALAAEKVGDLDVLVNNAGIVTGKPLLEASESEIDRTFDVNTKSLYWTTRAFLGGMIERRKGMIVTVASAAGMVGVAKQTDYSASKFAAFGFTESLRAELQKSGSGVDTLVVCPFYIDTGMFDGVKTKFPLLLPILHEDDVAEKMLKAIEAGKKQLIMPPFVRYLPAARLLPAPAFDKLMNFLGVNNTMDEFHGR